MLNVTLKPVRRMTLHFTTVEFYELADSSVEYPQRLGMVKTIVY